jgi:hypothetical protein
MPKSYPAPDLSPKHSEVANDYLADLEASLGAVSEEQITPKYAG